MGSQSDYPVVKKSEKVLKNLEIGFESRICSAHRQSDLMIKTAKFAHREGFKVIICAAGGAAHLPGMIASNTTFPVIGVPVETKSLKGLDSLLSIVSMPKPIPVATVQINNSENAAYLAASILSINDEKISLKLTKLRERVRKSIKKKPK